MPANTDMSPEFVELDRRIREKMRELRDQGRFSEAHADYIDGIDARLSHIRDEVERSIREGKFKEARGLELKRDYEAIWSDLGRFIERIDAAMMKAPKTRPTS